MLFRSFVVERIWDKKFRSLFVVLILCISVGISFSYIEWKKIDVVHERDAYEIALQVTKITKVTNVYYPESKYLKIATISEGVFPFSSQKLIQPTVTLSTNGFDSLKNFIQKNKDAGLTHIIVDDRLNRPNFLKEIFEHEMSYPYLTKIFDSYDHGLRYHVKIYKINYEEFSKYAE